MKFFSMIVELLVILFIVTSCALENTEPLTGAIPRAATEILPTAVPSLQPTPKSTLVHPKTTPTITPTITPIPDEVAGLVVEVIDGNTLAVVMKGDRLNRPYLVRYLNIQVPPNTPDNPWGVVAYETNRAMTQLKVVRLVRDKPEIDQEGRLLRNIYLGKTLINASLVEQGLARAAISDTNSTSREEILAAEARAKAGNVGLWGPLPTATSTLTATEQITNPLGSTTPMVIRRETTTPRPTRTATLTPTRTMTK